MNTSSKLESILHLCLDIDDTISYAPDFFRKLQSAFQSCRTTVVTFRTDYAEAETYLQSEQIRFDKLIVSTDPQLGKKPEQSLSDWKAEFVNQLKPDIFFEDMPEVVGLIDPAITVFMPCDDVIRGWIRQNC